MSSSSSISSSSTTSDSLSASSPVSFSTDTSASAVETSPVAMTNTNGLSSGAIAGIILAVVAIFLSAIVIFIVVWRRQQKRVHRSHQAAINRMTLVEPPSGADAFTLRSMNSASIDEREKSYASEEIYRVAPWTMLPQPPSYHSRQSSLAYSYDTKSGDGSPSSKSSDNGDGSVVFVDGRYVPSLRRENDA